MALPEAVPVTVTLSGVRRFSAFAPDIDGVRLAGNFVRALEEYAEEEGDAADLGEFLERFRDAAAPPEPSASLRTEGSLQASEGGILISYDESEITGMEGSSTVVRISDDGVVSLNRYGPVATNLVFKKHCRIQCLFDEAPDRALPVCVYTRDLKIVRSRSGGRVSVDYYLELGGSVGEHDEFVLSWKTDKSAGSGKQ